MKPDGKKSKDKKAKVPAAPITTRSPMYKLARTQANKARRMAKDARIKARKQPDVKVLYVALGYEMPQGASVWPKRADQAIYHLSRMLKEHAKHQVSQKHESKVEHVKLIKTQYSIEARAHVRGV